MLFTYTTYEDVVKQAIKLGNDTDTTAANAGGLAGIYYGFSNIPKSFIEDIREVEKIEEITENLIMKI